MPITTHVSRETCAVDRGRAFGRACRDGVRNTVNVYRRMLREDLGLDEREIREHGRRIEPVVRGWRPALCDELEGVALGAAQAPELLYAINARSELLSGGVVSGVVGAECSVVAVLASDRSRGVLAQTWDFHPAIRPSRVLWMRCFPDGSWHKTFTEAGLLAKLGVSSHGIAIGMNLLSSDRDGGGPGVPVHILMRTLLEEARTVEEVCELVEQAPASGSACLTIAGPDRTGTLRALALERWPGGVGVCVDLAGPSVVHTNHFVTPVAATDLIRGGPARQSTELRYAFLRAAVERGMAPEVSAVERLLSHESDDPAESIFRRDDISVRWLARSATTATVAFEVPGGVVWLRGGVDPADPLERSDPIGQEGGTM